LAEQTILDKWKAMFPGNSPEANENAVNGYGPDGGPKLVNAVKSPERDLPQGSDSWSSITQHPLKGSEGDILAILASLSNITGIEVPADGSFKGTFANGLEANSSTSHYLRAPNRGNSVEHTAFTGASDTNGQVQKLVEVGSSRLFNNSELSNFENKYKRAKTDQSGTISLAEFAAAVG
tara:strand:+ start:31 stop:567 length:537 start_codon:yes stop_codon:yes gene_type:complete